MPVRRKTAWSLDDAGQQRRFRQRNVLEIFVEIGSERFCESADAERTALPQGHPVCAELENLLLREFLLQFLRDQHLRHFALDRFLRSEEESASQLLRQRGTALRPPLPDHVLPNRLQRAAQVDPAMLKKTPVLDRQRRLHHNRWN